MRYGEALLSVRNMVCLVVRLAKFGGNYAKFAKSIDYDFSLGILCLNRLTVRQHNAKFAKNARCFRQVGKVVHEAKFSI